MLFRTPPFGTHRYDGNTKRPPPKKKSFPASAQGQKREIPVFVLPVFLSTDDDDEQLVASVHSLCHER